MKTIASVRMERAAELTDDQLWEDAFVLAAKAVTMKEQELGKRLSCTLRVDRIGTKSITNIDIQDPWKIDWRDVAGRGLLSAAILLPFYFIFH